MAGTPRSNNRSRNLQTPKTIRREKYAKTTAPERLHAFVGCWDRQKGDRVQCVVCGGPIASERGRPRKYCSAECVREAARLWNAEHPDYHRRWHEEHPGYRGAALRKWRAQHPYAVAWTNAVRSPPRLKACIRCGETFLVQGKGARRTLCDDCFERQYRHSRRYDLLADADEIDIDTLGDRDGWRCHLCRKRVARTRRWPDPLSKSIDHLVPWSAGGAHKWENVALAHLRCNIRRQNAGPAQLRLLG